MTRTIIAKQHGKMVWRETATVDSAPAELSDRDREYAAQVVKAGGEIGYFDLHLYIDGRETDFEILIA